MRLDLILKPGIVILFFWAIFTGEAKTQEKETASSKLKEIVDTFAGTWHGEGTAPEGEKFKSELNFRWTLNKNFIEVENSIKSGDDNGLFALTLYGWQPVMSHVVFWSFDRDGTINEGVAAFDGNSLKHEWRSFSRNGEIKDWRSTLTKHDANSISFSITDEQMDETFTVHYKRQK